MKHLLTLIFCAICAISYGQFSPTGTKTNFKNGIALGSKDSTAFNTNDSLAVTIDRNGRFMYRGLGAGAYWKVPQVGNDTVPDTRFVRLQQPTQFRQDGGFWISDTGRTSRLFRAPKFYGDTLQSSSSAGIAIVSNNGTLVSLHGLAGAAVSTFSGFAGYLSNSGGSYTARSFTDKNYVDSADALRVKYTDTATMLGNYVQKFGTLTNRRIPFVNNLGQLKDTTGFTWDAETLNIPGNILATGGVDAAYGFFTINQSGNVGSFQNTNTSGVGVYVQGGNNLDKYSLFVNGRLSADSIANFNPLGAYFYKKTYIKDTLFINTTNTIIDMDAAEKVNIVMDRGSNSYDNLITYETAATKNWEVGTRAGRTSFSIYNNSTATNGILIDSVTNEVSVASLKLSDWQQKITSGHIDFDYSSSNKFRLRNDGILQSKYAYEAYKDGSNTFGVGAYMALFNAAGTQGLLWQLDGSNDLSLFNEGGTRIGYFDQSTGAYTALSDSAAKKDITPYINSGISAIMKMKPKYYRMKADSADYRSLWFIAQDVKDAIPEAYIEKGGGNGEKPFIGINEKPIIANLVKAVQELKAENDKVKGELAELKAILKQKGIL